MSCHLRGADDLRHQLDRAFRGSNPQTLTIRDASCLGRCDQAPAMCVNDAIYGNVDGPRAVSMLQDILTGGPLPAESREIEPVQLAVDPYKGSPAYGVVKHFVETRNVDGRHRCSESSGLRGMGGAGFPTGTKWEIVRNAPGDEKYIVCNADESEPGTIKDRFIMENIPYLVIEGMITAGLVTGAKKGILYIRHEYERPREILQKEIDKCYAAEIAGVEHPGQRSDFRPGDFYQPGRVHLRRGKRVARGHRGKAGGATEQATLPRHSRSLAEADRDQQRGDLCLRDRHPDAGSGLVQSAGTERLARAQVRGHQRRRGAAGRLRGADGHQVFGTDLRICGRHSGDKKLLGFAPSGPSSGYLPASMVDLPLDWDAVAAKGSMVGSGAIVVCAEDRCMVDMALNAVRFFRNESCGKCVPCRMGSQKLVDMLTAWTHGKAENDDLQLLSELSHALKVTSICGLGQVVPVPIVSVLTHFRDSVDQHVIHKVCPAKVCFRGREAA